MTTQKTFSFKISKELQNEMINYFEFKKRDKTPPYALFQAREADTVVTLYTSGKVVFQGVSADIDAQMWKEREKQLTGTIIEDIQNKNKTIANQKKAENIDYYFVNSIGSDEVGTGDYFGPIIVCASYVNKKNIVFLENLGVRDSKKLTDEKIRKIAPEIIKRIPHVSITLKNDKYNELYSSNLNMNKLKAILHNKVLYNLLKKNNWDLEMIVIDQFENEKKYYEHLGNNPKIVKNITFTTKAEDKCLSVACSSIISRYLFIQEIEKMSDNLDIFIPLGAGPIVDEVAYKIAKKYNIDYLKNYVKYNFKNTEKIKEMINNS